MNPVPYMETLQRIAAGMGPQRGFQSSLNSLLSLLTERHGFLRPHLVIFDPETRTLRLCVADGAPRSAQVVYEPGMGVTGQVFVTGKPVIVECLKGHPVFLSKFFMRTDEELSSLAFLSVPVLAPQMSWEPGREQARKVIGVLSVDTPRASREELERQRCFLEVVAGMIAAQATYLQDDMARQQRLAERRGDRPHVAGDLDGGILAVSESMCEALKQASYAGHGRGPVLLRGEPGTGKARVAAFIHTASVRNELPLVRFYASRLQSPGADRLTEEQAERELFGYRKGAFPGAVQTRKGLFELANCSTLFIEDIDKLSLSIQAQILHVLQEQSVVRMGEGSPWAWTCVSSVHRRRIWKNWSPKVPFSKICTIVSPCFPLPCLRCANVLKTSFRWRICSSRRPPRPWGAQWSAFRHRHRNFFCNTRGRAMPESWPSA